MPDLIRHPCKLPTAALDSRVRYGNDKKMKKCQWHAKGQQHASLSYTHNNREPSLRFNTSTTPPSCLLILLRILIPHQFSCINHGFLPGLVVHVESYHTAGDDVFKVLTGNIICTGGERRVVPEEHRD